MQCLGDVCNAALADVAGLLTDKVLSDSPGPLHTLTAAVLAARNEDDDGDRVPTRSVLLGDDVTGLMVSFSAL